MQSRSAGKTYGTVAADQRKALSGLAFVQGLADGTLPLNTIAATLGYDISEAQSGRVVVTAQPNDTHLNPAGTVHGGLAATLLDSCMGLAIQSTLEQAGLHHPGIQDLVRAADHATNRAAAGRRHGDQPRPSRRHRRRTRHRQPGTLAGARDDDLPDPGGRASAWAGVDSSFESLIRTPAARPPS
jgi:uncharacterized protein (TIGR00369 family)